MSAIAAILGFGPAPLAEQAGEAMMQTLERYPADYSHTLQQDSLFMGCLGQRITPESAHERLPLASGGIVITADAILDNRTQLFDLLEIERPLRSSMTDSELIVRAYRRWDKRTPNYLIGDFAFLIWDERARTLFGARDVFGNRTLYYHRNAERIAFCTAIAPLFALPGVQRAVNPMWLAEFLSIPVMFESSDSASTAYESIEQLPPAHSFTLVNGAMRLERHGNLMPEEQLRLGSDGEYEEAFRDVFSQAVKSKLRTSRPVGSMLSGGLDSGAVSAFAARELALQGRPLKAFSYIPEPEFVDWTHRGRAADERPFIQATARYSGNIEEHYLDFAGKSPLTELDDWLDMLEMPYKYFENSFWLKGIYEEARRHGVGVMLNGARGNHTISWGPAKHYYAELLRKFRLIRLYREMKLFSSKRGIRRSHLLPQIGRQAFPLFDQWAASREEAELPKLIHPEFARRTNVAAKLQENEWTVSGFLRTDAMEARINHIHNLSIASTSGTKATKLSLRHGIAERDPTSDPRVVRLCFSIPFEQYVQHGVDRSLVRRATKGYLPDEVRLNQRTRGVQGADWIHRMRGQWPAFIGELEKMTRDPLAAHYLNVAEISQMLASCGPDPRIEQAFSPQTRYLMRSLIVYRFLQSV